MIVSDEHRYVFVEIPHTGSTAVSAELREFYGGRPMLHKHARLSEFLRSAAPAQREYRTVAGIRNPLDIIVTRYFKYRNNHQQIFTTPRYRKDQGGWVDAAHLERFAFVQQGADFAAYFRRFHRRPFDAGTRQDHRDFDFVLRFERLSDDFAALLAQLGIAAVRPLPMVNRTSGRDQPFWEYYPPDLRQQAVDVCGPYMMEWGYTVPEAWGTLRPALWSRAWYRGGKLLRRRQATARRADR